MRASRDLRPFQQVLAAASPGRRQVGSQRPCNGALEAGGFPEAGPRTSYSSISKCSVLESADEDRTSDARGTDPRALTPSKMLARVLHAAESLGSGGAPAAHLPAGEAPWATGEGVRCTRGKAWVGGLGPGAAGSFPGGQIWSPSFSAEGPCAAAGPALPAAPARWRPRPADGREGGAGAECAPAPRAHLRGSHKGAGRPAPRRRQRRGPARRRFLLPAAGWSQALPGRGAQPRTRCAGLAPQACAPSEAWAQLHTHTLGICTYGPTPGFTRERSRLPSSPQYTPSQGPTTQGAHAGPQTLTWDTHTVPPTWRLSVHAPQHAQAVSRPPLQSGPGSLTSARKGQLQALHAPPSHHVKRILPQNSSVPRVPAFWVPLFPSPSPVGTANLYVLEVIRLPPQGKAACAEAAFAQ